MSMIGEFKEFAVKGNVVDMAVGIIVGGAFGTIVKSLVEDVLMPPFGLALGGLDVGAKHIVLKAGTAGATHFASLADAKKAGAITLNYGSFINNVITFMLVSFSVFLLVKAINRAKRTEPEVAPITTKKPCGSCTLEIPLAATRCPNCTSEQPSEVH